MARDFLYLPRINTYVMPIHLTNGATVVSSKDNLDQRNHSLKQDIFALESRCRRLKRELRMNGGG